MWRRHLTLALALAGTVAYKPRTRKGRTDKDVERREASSASFDQMHDDYCATTDKDASPACADWAKRKNMEHRGKAPQPHMDEVEAMHEKFCGDPKNAAASQCARAPRRSSSRAGRSRAARSGTGGCSGRRRKPQRLRALELKSSCLKLRVVTGIGRRAGASARLPAEPCATSDEMAGGARASPLPARSRASRPSTASSRRCA